MLCHMPLSTIIFIGHFSPSYLKPFYISVACIEVSIPFETYYFWCEWISHNFIFVTFFLFFKSHCLIPKISLWHFQNELFLSFLVKLTSRNTYFHLSIRRKGNETMCLICARVNSRNFKCIKVYTIFYLCNNPVNKTIGGKIFFEYLPCELCPAIPQVRYVDIVQN